MSGQGSVEMMTAVVSGLFLSNSLLQIPNIFNDVDVVTNHYKNLTNCFPDFVISLFTMLVLIVVSDKLKSKSKKIDAGTQMLICHVLVLILSGIAYYFQIGNSSWNSMVNELKFRCMTSQIIMITICFLVYKHIERLR
jgi:hypothetical protein